MKKFINDSINRIDKNCEFSFNKHLDAKGGKLCRPWFDGNAIGIIEHIYTLNQVMNPLKFKNQLIEPFWSRSEDRRREIRYKQVFDDNKDLFEALGDE